MVVVIDAEGKSVQDGTLFSKPVEEILKGNGIDFSVVRMFEDSFWLKRNASQIIREKTAVIISGSFEDLQSECGWKTELEAFVREAIAASSPLLGICFGAQMIFKEINPDAIVLQSAGEVGDIVVNIEDDAQDTLGLKDGIGYYSFHFDGILYDQAHDEDVSCVAKNHIPGSQMEIYEAFQLRDKPIYGVQFHPELGYEQFVKLLEKNEAVLESHDIELSKLLANLQVHPSRQEIILGFARKHGE